MTQRIKGCAGCGKEIEKPVYYGIVLVSINGPRRIYNICQECFMEHWSLIKNGKR